MRKRGGKSREERRVVDRREKVRRGEESEYTRVKLYTRNDAI